jgi:tetratricopeptide (TPR) repeat protein
MQVPATDYLERMPLSRLESFRQLAAKNPANVLAHYGLANEAMKEGLYEEARAHYAAYLAAYDDEGNGHGRHAQALVELEQLDAARDALRAGIAAANKFGHPGMAADLQTRLEELG